MSEDDTLATRAAARLTKLLADQGFPLDPLGRTTALSETLQTSFQRAQQLLSGLVEWTNAELQLVCRHFDTEPGYFLDSSYGGQLPSDTVVVPASDGGEAIAWRTPHGFLRQPPAAGTPLRYVTGRREIFGHVPGTLFVYAREPSTHHSVVDGQLYVVDQGAELAVMRCTSSREAIASFEDGERSGIAVVVAFKSDDEPAENPRVVGRVIAVITPAG